MASPPDEPAKASHDNPAAVPTAFVLEVVERANDRLLDRIGSLDAFLGVLMTAALAVILLTIDRFRLIGFYADVDFGWVAMSLLAFAFLASMFGWLRGNDTLLARMLRYGDGREAEIDAPIPRRFVWAVGKKGEQALIETIRAIDANFERCYPVRSFKRTMASLALVLIVLGTVSAVVTKVVYLYGNDAAGQSSAPETGLRDRGGRAHPHRSGR